MIRQRLHDSREMNGRLCFFSDDQSFFMVVRAKTYQTASIGIALICNCKLIKKLVVSACKVQRFHSNCMGVADLYINPFNHEYGI